jgi:hypothetical protein
VTVSPHLRGIVLAGALAILAGALGLVTLAMNQSASKAATHKILSLKERHRLATGSKSQTPHVKPAPVDPNLTAALKAGLPRSVAKGLAAHPVVVVELSSAHDPVAELSSQEAQSGAELAGASFLSISVDRDGGDAAKLTRLLGVLPVAPAALVYQRPATLYVTLPGFNDRTVVQQAAANAALTAGGIATRATNVATWGTRAAALCTKTSGQLDAVGSPKSAAQLAPQKAKFEAISTSFLAQFKSLHPAAGQAAKVRQLNTLLTQHFAAVDAVIAAYTLHHGKAAVAALVRVANLAPRIDALERQLGASGCAVLSA